MKIKAGDMVRVTAGKDRGKEGKVVQALPRLGLVVVDGVRTSVRHLKARGKQPGQRVTYQAPIRVENVTKIAQAEKAESKKKAPASKTAKAKANPSTSSEQKA